MSLFTPDLMLSSIQKIDKPLLDQHGIKGIILDVDNTLTAHGSQAVEQVILDWLEKMTTYGIKLIIVSNNNNRRIRPFAEKLGLEYVAMSCKPMTFAFTKAHRKIGLKSSEIAVVGDQIYTDILGGNLKRMFTILVQPYSLEHGLIYRVKRRFEKIHIKKYHRHNPDGL